VTRKRLKPGTVSVETACELLGVGRGTGYKAAREGHLAAGVPVIRVGGRIMVPIAPLKKILGIDQAIDEPDDDADAEPG
jgi:excisionase family DNA binding protein